MTFNSKLSFTPHAKNVRHSTAQSLYALRLLRSHGLEGPSLCDVTQATVMARLRYASQAWWGFLDSASLAGLSGAVRKLRKQGFLATDYPDLEELFVDDDSKLFKNVVSNPHHVLHQLLPPTQKQVYSARTIYSLTSVGEESIFNYP